MVLWSQCKGVTEEGSGDINVFKIISDETFKARPREVGESCCTVWMVDRTLVQNQLKMFYGSIQVRDILACHVFDKSGVARICVSSNLGVQE
jgi:hypothetical protein